MKNSLKVFNNEQFGEVRVIEKDSKPYFCGKDVAIALGYSNTKDALLRHCKENGVVKHDLIDRMGRKQKVVFIDEGNVYRLITHSKLPAAEKFESWVFDEVLPAIRQTGKYEVSEDQKAREEIRRLNAEARARNARSRETEKWLKLADKSLAPVSKQICYAKASYVLSGGEYVLPLPELPNKTYSASEIGAILGVSSNRIGRLAKANNLKTEENGVWVMDKSQSSAKEMSVFRYFEKMIEVFRGLLNREAA